MQQEIKQRPKQALAEGALLLSAAAPSCAGHSRLPLLGCHWPGPQGWWPWNRMGHQDLVRQEVQEESYWPAFFAQSAQWGFPSLIASQQATPKMPITETDSPNASGWKPAMWEVWEEATIMRTKCLVAEAACFGAGDVNLPRSDSIPPAMPVTWDKGEGWPQSPSLLKAHPASKSALSKQAVVAALGHSVVISSPCVIQPVFTLGSLFPGSIRRPITNTNSIIYLKKSTTGGICLRCTVWEAVMRRYLASQFPRPIEPGSATWLQGLSLSQKPCEEQAGDWSYVLCTLRVHGSWQQHQEIEKWTNPE